MCAIEDLVGGHVHLIHRTMLALGLREESLLGGEAASAGGEALVKAAREYDPSRGIPFEPYVAQRLRWAMLTAIEKGSRHRTVSLDYDPTGDGANLGSAVADRNADDPGELASARELASRKQKRGSAMMKNNDIKAKTPKLSGIGEWAEALRKAAYDGVRETDISEIMGVLILKAKEGDMKAARFVLDYLTGSAAPRPKPSE